ncbi:hypothetical protein FQN51_007343 [Onygenales sp. PD_10]|nr:hypothetical protein FQN51_007343 [Onygenales sp. PD_10]
MIQMDGAAPSTRALELSVKQAVKSTSTCTSDTTSSLTRLLLPAESLHRDAERPKSVKPIRRAACSTGRKAPKPVQPRSSTKLATCPLSADTQGDSLSQKEKLILATEVFNTASKTLSDYIKSPKNGTTALHKKLTSKRESQPISPVSASCSPTKLKTLDASRSNEDILDSGIVEVANCARLALSSIREFRCPIGEEAQLNEQLEQGFCILIGKLLAVGLHDAAVAELRKLKRRIQGYMENEAVGGKTKPEKKGARSRMLTEPPKETLTDLIQVDRIPSDDRLLGLLISFQANALKAIAADRRPSAVNKMSEILLLSNPASPANIILRACKKGTMPHEKAAQQLQSLSYAILSLSLSTSNTEDGKASTAKTRVKHTATLNLQLLSLEIRCLWWKICGHKCDVAKELWDPLARYIASFARRCSTILKGDFEIVKQAFLRLESTVTENGYTFIPGGNQVPSVSTVLKVLGQLAQTAECSPDALKFYDDCIPTIAPDQPLVLGICYCKIALLRLETLRTSKIGRASKTAAAVSEAIKCLAAPLKGNQSDLEELLIESAKLKKAAMCFLNTLGEIAPDANDGDSGYGALGLYVIQYLNGFVRFLARYTGQASSRSSSDATNSLFQQRLAKCKNIVLAAVDSVIAVGKISVVAKRPSWTDTESLLSDCSTLLGCIHSAESATDETDIADSTPSSFVKLSNLYWSRYVKQKEIGAPPSELVPLLERSTCLLRTCPPDNTAGFAAAKYERLASLYLEVAQTKKAMLAYRSAIQAHINGGALNYATEARTKPLSYTLKDPSFPLGRVLTHYIRFCWKHCNDPNAAVFDDASLETNDRGVLLECQLMALLDSPASRGSEGTTSHLPTLISSLLSLYPPHVHPMRRLRIMLKVIRCSLHSPSDFGQSLLEMIIGEAKLFLAGDLELAEDSVLSTFKESSLASLRLTLGLLQGDLSPDSLQQVVHTWSSVIQNCQNWDNIAAVIDDPETWISQVKVLINYLDVLGLWKLRISALSMLRHVLEIQNAKDFSDTALCLSQLGVQYTRLGYFGKAGSLFNLSHSLIQKNTVSPSVFVSWTISFAEYLTMIGNLDKATETLSHAKEVFEQNVSDVLKLNFEARLAWERLVAESAYLHSRIHFELGSIDHAIFFAKCAVKLNNRIWAKLDRFSEMKRDRPSSSSGSELDMISNKIKAIDLSSGDCYSGNTYREGSLYWPHFVPHCSGLVNLCKFSAHNGLFQDSVYFGEQALKIAKAVGSTFWTAAIQAELGKVWVRGGHVQNGKDSLDAAAQVFNGLEKSLGTVSLHTAFSRLYQAQGKPRDENHSLDLAHQTLEEISGWDTPEQRDSASESGLEAKMSQLTLKAKSRTQRPLAPRQTRGRRAKQSENLTSTNVTASTTELQAGFPSFSQLRVDLLHQQVVALLSCQQFNEAFALLEKSEQLPKSKVREMAYNITKAQCSLRSSVQNLASHAVFCVLPESTISLPSLYLPTKPAEEHSTKKATSTRRPKPPTSTTKKSGTKNGPDDFTDVLSTANDLLNIASSSAPVHGSTDDNHNLSFISSQVCMLSHATATKTEGLPTPLQAAAMIENGRNMAFLREHSSITIDKELCGPVEPLKWLKTPQRDCAKLDQLSAGEFMRDYVDNLPENWNVLSLTLSDDRHEFIISKLRSGQSPFLLRLPLKRGMSDDMDEEEFGFEEGKAELLEIVTLANQSAHDARSRVEKNAKKEWWANRESLDKRLKNLLDNMETIWFGGFRGIFSECPRNEPLLARFVDSFEKILDKHLPSRRHRRKIKLCKPNFHWDVMELFVNIGNIENGSDLEDLVTDLLYFIVDILQFNGERNAYDEIDFDMMVIDTLDAIRSYKEAEQREQIAVQSRHTILILDKELHSFPWESLGCLRGSSVSRMPSLRHLKETLVKCQAANPATPDGFIIDRKAGSYILNPGGDLKSTQTAFENSLVSLDGWNGIANREPSEEEFKECLENKDLLLYFGHGSGAQYIRGRTIKRLDRCAVTFLMGCSSGALTEAGEFEPYGTPMNYMHAGAPALVATLWDVTDKDIDRFAQCTFEQWGLMEKGPAVASQSCKSRATKAAKSHQSSAARQIEKDGPVGLDTAVANSRGACIFRYLNGAAPVVYGVPVFFK